MRREGQRSLGSGRLALIVDVEEQDKKAQQAHVERLWEMIAEQRECIGKSPTRPLTFRGSPDTPRAVS
jgi:hypothetical protein